MIEYSVQYLHQDGSWRLSFAGEVRQMRTMAGALAALDRARRVCPNDTWRLVSRVIPDWAPADEAALRAAAAPEVTS